MGTTSTSWINVAVLIGAGAAVALQIGKVPAALPMLQSELGLSLVQSGWVVAIFSVVAAGLAIFLGVVSDRFGHLEVAVFGMVLSALAGVAGGFVYRGDFLLTTRALEGFGFILTTTSIPSLIILAASDRHKKTSLALWGMYMPLGSGIMLALSGPLLFFFDWRVLWWVTSVLIFLIAIPVFRVGSRLSSRRPDRTYRPVMGDSLKYALQRGPVLLSLIFAIYAALYLIVAGFLPLVLIELNGFSALAAASVSAVVIFCNVLGNGISGWLHNHGFQFRVLVRVGSLGMAIGGTLVFMQHIPGIWRVFAAAGFCGFAGLVPSSIFSEFPNQSPHPSAVATINGLLVQGAAIGQLVGPPITAGIVAWYGNWSATIPIMIVGAAFVIVCTAFVPSSGKETQN